MRGPAPKQRNPIPHVRILAFQQFSSKGMESVVWELIAQLSTPVLGSTEDMMDDAT